jgi:hypothetical protein
MPQRAVLTLTAAGGLPLEKRSVFLSLVDQIAMCVAGIETQELFNCHTYLATAADYGMVAQNPALCTLSAGVCARPSAGGKDKHPLRASDYPAMILARQAKGAVLLACICALAATFTRIRNRNSLRPPNRHKSL